MYVGLQQHYPVLQVYDSISQHLRILATEACSGANTRLPEPTKAWTIPTRVGFSDSKQVLQVHPKPYYYIVLYYMIL